MPLFWALSSVRLTDVKFRDVLVFASRFDGEREARYP
jgi:hypothetical protein